MEGVECRLLEYRPIAPRTAPHDRMVLGWRNQIGSHLAKRRGLVDTSAARPPHRPRATRPAGPPAGRAAVCVSVYTLL